MKKNTAEIKIVIVEDDREKREELVELLRDLGFRLDNITTSGYAEKGIDFIEEELPDVVLLDLKIPFSEESESIKIDNSNKVIKAVERINAVRNQEECSTGIIIISASVEDDGLRKNYTRTPEVVDFFDKDEIALDKDKFKTELFRKIHTAVERDFKHKCEIELSEIRKIKLKKLESINKELYDRIALNLLGQFKQLNNRDVNTNQIVEGIIGLSGRIVEDILNLVEDKYAALTIVDDSDNFYTVRNRLNSLTGRKWDKDDRKLKIIGEAVFSRKAAEFARFAYQLRSEAVHSKERDVENKKLFVDNKYDMEDAVVAISLIMPLIKEFIDYMDAK